MVVALFLLTKQHKLFFMCMERLGMGVALLIRAVTCISVWIELKVVQSFRCLHSSWLDLCSKDVCL